MFRMKHAVRATALIVVAACSSDAGNPLAPGGEPLKAISDAAHAGAVPGFYFLPPMVAQPVYSGTFDAAVAPRVEICELAGDACATVLVEYTLSSGLSVNAGAEHYQASWQTQQFDLDVQKHYRISVFAGSLRLGFADVDVVGSGKDLKNVDTGEFIPLVDGRTLPIKFRIETGIVGQVVVSPDSADIAVGETQQFTATLLDLHGNPISGPLVTWSSLDEGVATVDGAGLATGVGVGGTTITATTQGASGSAVLTVFNPNEPPVAVADTFDAIGNFTVPVSAPGVLANDTDPDGDPLSAVAGTYPTAQGGTFTLNPDGSFTYLSPAGFTGVDEAAYEVTDGLATAASTATFLVPTRVWYVSNAGASPGDGRDASPFTALKSAEAASLAGETIFVLAGDGTSAGLDAGIVLKNAQSLTGQGLPASVTASLNGETVVLLAAGSAPALTRSDAGATVALAQGNTVQGVDIASTAGAGIAGTGFGTLTAGSVSVAAAGGPSLDLSNGTAAAAFSELSSAGSAGAGLRLASVGGVISAPAGTVVGAAGAGVEVAGGDGDVAYGGNVVSAGPRPVSVTGRTGGILTLSGTIASTGQGILVQGNGGGTIAFTGSMKSLSTGANHGVEIVANAGATVQFGGGGLAVATTTGEALRATGGGTVSVTGAGNTLTSGSGAALRVENTSTGAAGMTFRSISANGAAPAIVLHDLGGSAGVQVTGDGVTPGSGGVVANAAADAVLISGATAVFARLRIEDVTGNGVAVGAGGSLSLRRSEVLRTTGHGVAGTPSASLGLNVDVEESTFEEIGGRSAFIGTAPIGSTAASTLRFVGNSVTVAGPGKQGGVLAAATAASSIAVTVTDNSFSGVGGPGVIAADAKDNASVSGSVLRNSISAASASGVVAAVEGSGIATVRIHDNQITAAGSDGIQLVNFGGGASSLQVAVTDNTIAGHNQNPAAAFLAGITVFGFDGTTCLALRGNGVTGTSPGYEGIYLESAGGSFLYEEDPDTPATGLVTPAHVLAENPAGTASVNGPITLSDGIACARP